MLLGTNREKWRRVEIEIIRKGVKKVCVIKVGKKQRVDARVDQAWIH
jgi:hypothetical protein